MFDGWIKLYRRLLEKPIWKLSTPEQKVILITLVLMASHKFSEWEWDKEKFIIQPGQFITSLENIREKAGKGISIQNIRTSLVRFEKLEFLTNKSTKQGRLISIINWDTYQAEEIQANKVDNKELTKTSQRANNYQECKNIKNEKKNNLFEHFWLAYPKKKNKGMAEKAFKKIKPSKKFLDTMLAKIELLKKTNDWQKDNGQYIPYPSTWLNAKGWEDEIDEESRWDSITKKLEEIENEGKDDKSTISNSN